jgi:uncharacterized OsmC-like protein
MLHIPSKHLNGIDVKALGKVAEAVEQDPGKAKVSFAVDTRWTGQTGSETTITGVRVSDEGVVRSHKIFADEPTQLLGSDSAPNPQELLMAALNACMTVGYVAGASVRGIKLDSLEIRTTGDLDLRGFLGLDEAVPAGYESIDYEVRISGDGTREQFEEIHRAVMKTSPNYFNLSRPVRLNGALQVADGLLRERQQL